MEELWKDMSLTSTPAALQYHLSSPALDAAAAASYRDSLPHVDPFAFAFPRTNHGTGGRRATAAVQSSEVGSGDRRQRRMIKNRESAARSRARRQAHTNELELELAQLRRENAMLIKREQDLHARLALAAQAPDRSTLQRCRSAPAL